MSKVIVNRVSRATILALGMSAAGLAFAATPVSAGTYTAVSPNSSPREDVADLQTRANQMDELISNNESAILTSEPSLGTQWMNRIVVSGNIYADGRLSSRSYQDVGSAGASRNPTAFGAASQSGSTFGSKSSSGLSLGESEIDLDAQINCWVKAHLTLSGNDGDDTDQFHSDVNNGVFTPIYSDNNTLMAPEDKLTMDERWIDEAYVTLGDFTRSPFYATAGRGYVPFGHYTKHELTPEMTTILTETQASAFANAGFATPFYDNSMVHGSAFTLSGLRKAGKPQQLRNFGGDLGISKKDPTFGYNTGVSYLNNMADTNSSTNVIAFGGGAIGAAATGANEQYTKSVGAVSAHAGANYGPFNAEVNGVTALSHYNVADLAYACGANGACRGAQPAAVGALAGYNFDTVGHDSQFYLRYGHSWESAGLAQPQNRYLAGYSIDLAKNTTMEFQGMYNDDYSTKKGGTGEGDWEGAVRLGVHF